MSSALFLTARLASRAVQQIVRRPLLCKWAFGGRRCLANDTTLSPIDKDLFERLKEAKLKKLGSILEVFRENRQSFNGLHALMALTLIDAEASARARTRRAYEINMDSVRRAPEVPELVEKAVAYCERLDPHMFGNLLILLGSFRMYTNTDAVDSLMDVAPAKVAELKFSALLSIGTSIKGQPGALNMVDLILRCLADRLDEAKDDLASSICEILSIVGAVEEGLSPATFQQVLAALKKQVGGTSADDLRDMCRSASTLAQRKAISVLEVLAPEIQRTAAGASAGCLASIVYYFGQSACVDIAFWKKLLGQMTAKLSECSQWSLTQAAKGVSECPEISIKMKKRFLNKVTSTSIPNLESFDTAQLVVLAGAFAKAEYKHDPMIMALVKSSRRLIKHFKPWCFPDLLTALAKLNCHDVDLLADVADHIHDFSQFEACKLKDIVEVFAAAKYRDLRMLDIFSGQVAQRWQEISTEDFEIICSCLSTLGYHSDKFEKHKFARLPARPDVVREYSQLKLLRKRQREWTSKARHGRKLKFGKKIGVPEWGSVVLGKHEPHSA